MTAPYYQDEMVTLYHGDCLKILPTLPSESAHVLLTDPPYNVAYAGKTADQLTIANDDMSGEQYRAFLDSHR